MKKGLGATHPAPTTKHAQLKPTSTANTLANRQQTLQATNTTAGSASDKPSKPLDYIWEPTLKIFAEEEIRKVSHTMTLLSIIFYLFSLR